MTSEVLVGESSDSSEVEEESLSVLSVLLSSLDSTGGAVDWLVRESSLTSWRRKDIIKNIC